MNDPMLRIIDEENVFRVITFGKPYHPRQNAIVFLKKGEISYKYNLEEVKLSGPAIAVINRDAVYEFKSMSNDIEIRTVHFNRNFIEKMHLTINRYNFYEYMISGVFNSFNVTEREIDGIWKYIEILRKHIKKNPKNRFYDEILRHLFSLLMYVTVEIFERYNDVAQKSMSRQEEIVLTFLKEVAKNYKKQRKVTFYAQQQYITPQHLADTLKSVTGKTPNEIITEFLVIEAKAALTSTRKPVKEIALDLQFSDQYTFSHFFKKKTGKSPTAYRRKNKI